MARKGNLKIAPSTGKVFATSDSLPTNLSTCWCAFTGALTRTDEDVY